MTGLIIAAVILPPAALMWLTIKAMAKARRLQDAEDFEGLNAQRRMK